MSVHLVAQGDVVCLKNLGRMTNDGKIKKNW